LFQSDQIEAQFDPIPIVVQDPPPTTTTTTTTTTTILQFEHQNSIIIIERKRGKWMHDMQKGMYFLLFEQLSLFHSFIGAS
jgi:hypothetical protein